MHQLKLIATRHEAVLRRSDNVSSIDQSDELFDLIRSYLENAVDAYIIVRMFTICREAGIRKYVVMLHFARVKI